jgi:hypothetical protein
LSIFIVAKLTGEFTSLEEPTDDPDIVIVLILLADGPDLVDLKGESNPKVQCRNLMSTHASVLVDSVGPPSAEVCRAAASFP